MPASMVGSRSAPTLSRPSDPPFWRSLTASSLTIVVPRSNGPTRAGTTIVMRASSPGAAGAEKNTLPGVCAGEPPLPTTTSTLPIRDSGPHVPARARSRAQTGILPSTPTSPSGSATSAETRFCEPSGTVIVVVSAESAPAASGSDSSESVGANGFGPVHPEIVKPSLGVAAAGAAAALPSSWIAAHGCTRVPTVNGPHESGLTSVAWSPPKKRCSTS